MFPGKKWIRCWRVHSAESCEFERVGNSCCFFFSSRRRHTRWTGDWSSDVCSSDLVAHLQIVSFGTAILAERVDEFSRQIEFAHLQYSVKILAQKTVQLR